MTAFDPNDIRINRLAATLLRRYGHRLTLAQLADYLGSPHEVIRQVPHETLPRMSVNKLGTVYYCLDAARYIVSTYPHHAV